MFFRYHSVHTFVAGVSRNVCGMLVLMIYMLLPHIFFFKQMHLSSHLQLFPGVAVCVAMATAPHKHTSVVSQFVYLEGRQVVVGGRCFLL